MADEPTNQQDTQDAQAASGAQGGGADAAGQDTAPPAAGKTFTQDELDRIVADRIAREKRAADKRASELETELAGFREAETKRKEAEMTEAQKAEEARKAAEARAQQLEAELTAARTDALRSQIIAAEAADLPLAYRLQVTGADEDAIKESVGNVRKQFETDRAAWLRGLASMTPEDIAAQYGEDVASPLVARLTGKPQSVGAAPRSSVPADPPAEWSPDNNTPEAWRKERERRGIGSLRP